MPTASISELKANLSRYVREVRRGGEVQVLFRGRPVARLVPPAAVHDDDRQRLIAAGILRAGKGNAGAILDQAPLRVGTSVLDAVLEERREAPF